MIAPSRGGRRCPPADPAVTCIVFGGSTLSCVVYGAMTSLAPHCAIGISGAPVSRATRSAPVLPVIGQMPGSRVIVPSGYITRHSPPARRPRPRPAPCAGPCPARPGSARRRRMICPTTRDVEDGLLGHEPRRPAVVVQEVGHDQRIEERDVVGGHDDPLAVPAQVLRPPPVPPGHDHERRPQHDLGDAVGDAEVHEERLRAHHPPLPLAVAGRHRIPAEVPSAGSAERGRCARARDEPARFAACWGSWSTGRIVRARSSQTGPHDVGAR